MAWKDNVNPSRDARFSTRHTKFCKHDNFICYAAANSLHDDMLNGAVGTFCPKIKIILLFRFWFSTSKSKICLEKKKKIRCEKIWTFSPKTCEIGFLDYLGIYPHFFLRKYTCKYWHMTTAAMWPREASVVICQRVVIWQRGLIKILMKVLKKSDFRLNRSENNLNSLPKPIRTSFPMVISLCVETSKF